MCETIALPSALNIAARSAGFAAAAVSTAAWIASPSASPFIAIVASLFREHLRARVRERVVGLSRERIDPGADHDALAGRPRRRAGNDHLARSARRDRDVAVGM